MNDNDFSPNRMDVPEETDKEKLLERVIDGNENISNICSKLLKVPLLWGHGKRLSAIHGSVSILHILDTLNICGSRLEVLYKDVCEYHLGKMVAILRAHQLGECTMTEIYYAINNHDSDINLDIIVEKVKESIPSFDLESYIEKNLVEKVIEGNENVRTICSNLLREPLLWSHTEHPSAIGSSLSILQTLNDLDIRGKHLEILYKDVCEHHLGKVVAILRAYQLGEYTKAELYYAIEKHGSSISLDIIVEKIKKRIPSFDPESYISSPLKS